MASSDIYQVKESPWAKNPEPPRKSRHRRYRKTFDEAVNPDISHTHRRRSRNSGVRRLQHLLKRPEFSRKFWLSTLGVLGLILTLLILWDIFLRYPKQKTESRPDVYRAVVE